MSVIKIDYDHLSGVAKNADRVSRELKDYADELSKKVSNKYSSIEGGQSTKTTNSQYYVKQKIKSLNTKSTAYKNYASGIRNLSQKAKDVDKDVAKKINAAKNDFIDKHDYVDTNWWTDLKEWFIDLKNKCPIFDAICNLISKAVDGVKHVLSYLKHWYKCGGGKEIFGFALAILGAIAAVLILIASFPVSGVVAACAAIGAAIAAVNAIVNVVTSYKAMTASDPAWAKIYGDQDTAQDVLRQTNWGDGFVNKLSNFAAFGIDVVQLVCDVVADVRGKVNLAEACVVVSVENNDSVCRYNKKCSILFEPSILVCWRAVPIALQGLSLSFAS